jgi:hypothetical protein
MREQSLWACLRRALRCAVSGLVPHMKHFRCNTWRSLSTCPWWLIPTRNVTATSTLNYEVVSNIFLTGAAIYTTVMVARSTGPNRPNCDFRVLLRSFAATAWKRAKTSPRTLARTGLAASPWKRPDSHFRPHPAVCSEIQNGCRPPPTVLPWFSLLWRVTVAILSYSRARRKSGINVSASQTPIFMDHYCSNNSPRTITNPCIV